MSYCVNCGVELDPTASRCPLCGTPVVNPNAPVDRESPTPFPMGRMEVEPVDRRSVGILLTGMLASLAVCCGILNVVAFFQQVPWSWFVAGAAGLIWVWSALPLLVPMPLPVCMLADLAGIAGFLALVAWKTQGWYWYKELALPIVALTGLLGGSLAHCLIRRHSRLTTLLIFLVVIGVYLVGLEILIDLFKDGVYTPGWSLIVAAVILVVGAVFLTVRLRPRLREEFRRRFHS